MERRMEILIIGGNRFVGKKVVSTLYKEHNITVLNRKGTSPVSILSCNIIRQNRNELKELQEYDIVIDMCLYNLEQTKNIVSILETKTTIRKLYKGFKLTLDYFKTHICFRNR